MKMRKSVSSFGGYILMSICKICIL